MKIRQSHQDRAARASGADNQHTDRAPFEELLGERVLDPHNQYPSVRTNFESVSPNGIRASAGKRVLFPARLPQRTSKPPLCRVVLPTLA
ncbi:MAG: hypothetical protein QOE55_7587 [Acidobacteriaceae bacterium]|nr:hypothetical protein [Acidobacteriaceae bacterium]